MSRPRSAKRRDRSAIMPVPISEPEWTKLKESYRQSRKEVIDILRRHKVKASCAVALGVVLASAVEGRKRIQAVADIVAEVDKAAEPLLRPIKKLLATEEKERLPWVLGWRMRGVDDPFALAKQLHLLIDKRPRIAHMRGRPPDWATRSLLSSLASIYERGTGKTATANRSKEDSPTWGPFIRFATDCARLAGYSVATESALGSAWIRRPKKKREAGTKLHA